MSKFIKSFALLSIYLLSCSASATHTVACPSCSTPSSFETAAIGEAYSIVGSMPEGTYYPHIYVVNFNSATLKKYEVRADVVSSSNSPHVTIPTIISTINQELVPSLELHQDMQQFPKLYDAVTDVGLRLVRWNDWYGSGGNVYDFVGDNQAYNQMQNIYRDSVINELGYFTFSVQWNMTLAVAAVNFLAPVMTTVKVEFENGAFIEFDVSPRLSQIDGDALGFEFEFREAYDSDGNEVFEDADTYLNDELVNDVGQLGSGALDANSFASTAYLASLGFTITVNDFRTSFACFTQITSVCFIDLDGIKKCRVDAVCRQ